MQESGCYQEQAVMRAVGSGQWDLKLQAHAESCLHCKEVVRVSQFLRKLAAAPEPHLPSAGYVWWQSRLRERQTARSRVHQVLTMTRAAIVSVSIIAFGAWIVLHWAEVGKELKGSFGSLSDWSSANLASLAPALVYLSVALLCVNLALTVRAVVTNDKRE